MLCNSVYTDKQTDASYMCKSEHNLKNIYHEIFSVVGFWAEEKQKLSRLLSLSCAKKYDISTFPAEASQTPHSTVGQTPPLDCQSRCCISPTCDGKMIHWACQTASRDCVYWGVLTASTDRGGEKDHLLYCVVTCKCS